MNVYKIYETICLLVSMLSIILIIKKTVLKKLHLIEDCQLQLSAKKTQSYLLNKEYKCF